MHLDLARFVDVVVLSPKGRVDHTTAEALKTSLVSHLARCAQGQDHVVLDLAGVDYISSAGLRVLLVAAKKSKAAQCKFALCSLQPAVREVFEISGFGTIIAIHADRAGALAAAD